MPRVIVTCPTREGSHGYWCAGRFWHNGANDAVDVTSEELEALKSDPPKVLAVIDAETGEQLVPGALGTIPQAAQAAAREEIDRLGRLHAGALNEIERLKKELAKVRCAVKP
jgi:hypothetical protein